MNINEILDQIESGLEGVTRGPWEVKTNKAGNPTVGPSGSSGMLTPWVVDKDNAAHIARCDPDTIRAIIDAYRQMEARNKELEMLTDELDFLRHEGGPDSVAALEEKAAAFDAMEARAEAAEANLLKARNLLKRVPSAINSAFGAGMEEREGGSARRQAKAMAGPEILQCEIRAALAAMDETQ